jgi:hypothetical protein
VVRRHGIPYCIVLIELFLRHQEVENALLEVVKHANLHCMEEVMLWEVAHDTGNMPKHAESSVNMGRREFGIGCPGVAIGEHSI